MDSLLEQLKKPFPKSAHSTDSSRGKKTPLTSIRAQWVVERLNDVFGIFGWSFHPEYETVGDFVLCHGVLVVSEYDGNEVVNQRKVEQTGGCDKFLRPYNKEPYLKNAADVYKSAATDSLGKCASWLCIGNDVFKGNVDPLSFELKPEPVSEELVKAAAPVIEGLKKLSEEARKGLLTKYEFSRPSDLYKMTVPKLEAIAGEIERVLSFQEISETLDE